MGKEVPTFRADRAPAESYEDILARDTRPLPEHLRQQPRWDEGTDSIPVSRFYDPEYFKQEADHVWSRVWQWVCREEDIANVGDYKIYENLGKSLIIVRSAPDEIKAFYNFCLHRGRKLVNVEGCKQEFRCPFHGMIWNRDGSFKYNPIDWDFPQWKDKDMSLPEVKVDTWGGFVFINFDPDAPPLLEHIGPLADHFERYDFKNRYVSVHVRKQIRASWKIVAEAFMESHHSHATHPQVLPFLADVNSQYDILNDFVTRQFSAAAVTSPLYDPKPTEEEMLALMNFDRGAIGTWEMENNPTGLAEGVTARAFMADRMRKDLERDTGRDYDHATDAELLDSLLYNVFPHMSFWANYGPSLIYRWLPLGNDPERSTMEVLILTPLPEGGVRPPSAQIRELDFDTPVMTVEDLLGAAAPVFDQDMGNLPYVQEGLHAGGSGVMHYGRYTEGRIRHMYHMIQKYIDEGVAKAAG